MTDKEKWRNIQDILMRVYCSDDPAHKRLVLAANDGVSDAAWKLHAESLLIDGCVGWLHRANWITDTAGLTAIGLTVPIVFDNDGGAAVRETIHLHEIVHRAPDKMMLIQTVDDIVTAKKLGKTGIYYAAQHPDFLLHRSLESSVEVYQRMGLRTMALAYNTRSFAADGSRTYSNDGLTSQGKALIRALENAGVTVDLSHVGSKSAVEAMGCVTKPVIYSHSNPVALFPHPRNITDEQIRLCAACGGVIGVAAYPEILWDGKTLPCMERFVDTISYIADMVGVDYVGIGSDLPAEAGAHDRQEAWDIGDGYTGKDSPNPYGSPYQYCYDAGWGIETIDVRGFNSLANFPNLIEHLLRRGFSHGEVQKILGLNFLRVFKQTWQSSREGNA